MVTGHGARTEIGTGEVERDEARILCRAWLATENLVQ
jgi:hypothetical protein